MPFCVALAVRDMGMTPDEAVWSATAGGAAALRRDDVGRISPGARADLVRRPSQSTPGVPAGANRSCRTCGVRARGAGNCPDPLSVQIVREDIAGCAVSRGTASDTVARSTGGDALVRGHPPGDLPLLGLRIRHVRRNASSRV